MQKIALEEHFGVPSLLQYSAIGQYGFTKESGQDMNHRLQEFDELRLKAMEEGNIRPTLDLLSKKVVHLLGIGDGLLRIGGRFDSWLL